MKKANNFQKPKVQPQGVAQLLLDFFANFSLPLLTKVLLIKKSVLWSLRREGGGLEQSGRGEGLKKSPKPNQRARLFLTFSFLSNIFFYFSLYKTTKRLYITNIYFESLCWIEFFPNCNNEGGGGREGWNKNVLALISGVTSIRHQRVPNLIHLLSFLSQFLYSGEK